MTVSSEHNRNTVAGNDSTTVFNYTFLIFDREHLEVTHVNSNEVETLLVLDIDYENVTGVGNGSGGTITYPKTGAPLPTGEFLILRRAVPLTQEVDYENQGGYFPETAEVSEDLGTMADQQLAEQIDRALMLPMASGLDPESVLAALMLNNDLILPSNKGDMLAADGSIWSLIGVGANDQVLTADSSQALGVKWAASGAGPHDLASHSDVIVTSVANNEVLAYDVGGNWINQTAAEAGLATADHTHDGIRSIVMECPVAGDQLIIWHSDRVVTVTESMSVMLGGSAGDQVVYKIEHGSNLGALADLFANRTCTHYDDAGDAYTGSWTISDNDFVVLTIGTVTGEPDSFSVTLEF